MAGWGGGGGWRGGGGVSNLLCLCGRAGPGYVLYKSSIPARDWSQAGLGVDHLCTFNYDLPLASNPSPAAGLYTNTGKGGGRGGSGGGGGYRE